MNARIAAAVAATLLCTSAQASRIYAWQTERVYLGEQSLRQCDQPGELDTHFGCHWRQVRPSDITGTLHLADAADTLERFEFQVNAPYFPGGFADPRMTRFVFDSDSVSGEIQTDTLSNNVRLTGADGLWLGRYDDHQNYCNFAISERCNFIGRWVEQAPVAPRGPGPAPVPLPGTLPLMALAAFGIAAAMRKRG